MIRSAGLFVAMCAMPAMASLYTDPVGDIATGNSNLDITQVEVTDDGTDLIVRVTVDDLDGDWGKYLFFMDGWAGGSDDNDNPWANLHLCPNRFEHHFGDHSRGVAKRA